VIALDASALLALLYRETGHEVVAQEFDQSCISTVNLAEVIGRFARDGHEPRMVEQHLVEAPLDIVPFTATDAAVAGSFVPLTRPLGLSLGDRACLALGASRGVPVLTGDRVWAELDCGVTVRLIR
jgi:PIN domain nuclease of toxin-antitoxin system